MTGYNWNYRNISVWMNKTDKWRDIFGELTEEGVYEMGPVNYYRLASILEDLYVENQELKDKVEALEKDMELLKSYAWEK